MSAYDEWGTPVAEETLGQVQIDVGPVAGVAGERIQLLKSPFALKDEVKNLPSARALWTDPTMAKPKGTFRYWHVAATPESAASVLRLFRDYEIQSTRAFLELAAKSAQADEARKARGMTDGELMEPPGTMKAWLHQKQAYWFAHGQDAAYLAVGMGGGKSRIAINLMDGWNVSHVLILCPATVVDVWPKEFGKHGTRPWTVVAPRKGSVKARAAAMEQAAAMATPEYPVACVANYEALNREEFRQWARSRNWPLVILDESHRVKSPGGVQSQAVASLRDHSMRRLCLSGTPMPHSPLDLYAQFRFLDPGVFGTNYAKFRQKYAVMGGWMGKQVVGYQREDELSQMMARLAYIITKEQLDKTLGLPEAIHLEPRECRLSKQATHAYQGMLYDFVAGVQDGSVAVNNALTQLLRLQQITSGYLPVPRPCPACEGEGCGNCDGIGEVVTVEQLGTEKRDSFADWLSDLPGDEPVVVACRFTHDVDSIRSVAEATGRRFGELSGRSKDGLTREATMSPDVDLLGVQIQSGGVGIDLTRARYAYNYSLGFSLGDFDQWLARVHRPGQTRTTYYGYGVALLADGTPTVDGAVLRALMERREVVSAIVEAAREGQL